MIACDATSLAEAAKCYRCLTGAELERINTMLLARIAGGSTDPAALLAQAACYGGLTSKQHADVQTALLCAIQAK